MACRRSRHRKSAPAAAPVARSLSLRAASFREAVPGSSVFRSHSVQRPKQRKDDRARNSAALAAAHGKVRANLANTKLKKGSYDLPYCHSHSVADNHLIAARSWIVFNMPGVENQPIGVQSFDNGYLFAFAV